MSVHLSLPKGDCRKDKLIPSVCLYQIKCPSSPWVWVGETRGCWALGSNRTAPWPAGHAALPSFQRTDVGSATGWTQVALGKVQGEGGTPITLGEKERQRLC